MVGSTTSLTSQGRQLLQTPAARTSIARFFSKIAPMASTQPLPKSGNSTPMRELDLSYVRSRFPTLSDPNSRLKDMVYVDSAGGSHICQEVIDIKQDFLRDRHYQPFGYSEPSQEAGAMITATKERFATLLNVPPELAKETIHIGPSTTGNTDVLARSLGGLLEAGDEIILSTQNHEANIGAWEKLSQQGVVVKLWHVDPDTGSVDVEQLKSLMSDKTKFVAVPHSSNVIGEVNPVEEIVELAHEQGALVAVDGVAHAAHDFPDLQALDTDIYLLSTYKTFGPHTGLMYIKPDLAEQLPNMGHYFNGEFPDKKFVPAGPHYEDIASAAGVVDYLENLAAHHGTTVNDVQSLMRDQEIKLMKPLLDFLSQRDDVRLLGPATADSQRVPTIAFLPLKKSVPEVINILKQENIMAGASHFYAVRLLEDMDIPTEPGVVRFSLLHYDTPEAIDALIKATDKALS